MNITINEEQELKGAKSIWVDSYSEGLTNFNNSNRSIIEHVHNQMAVFTLGHCSNLTRSAWAYQNAEKSERQSRPID